MKKILILAAALLVLPAVAAFSGEGASAEALETHPDNAAEETALSPYSGNAPHIVILQNENSVSYTDDLTLTRWEREDAWEKMHELMPSYCKPYLEDAPFTGARNVVENELSINFSRDFPCPVGYKHYYQNAGLAGLGEAEIVGSVNGYTLTKRSAGELYAYFLADGSKVMYLAFAAPAVFDVLKTDKYYAVLYGGNTSVYAQYIYPGGLEGKDLSYAYKVQTCKNAADIPSAGRFLTGNLVRLQFPGGRIRHWQVKQSEADLANYGPNDFILEQKEGYRGIWKELRTLKRLLWTNDAADPLLHQPLADYNAAAYNFSGDTAKEPVYK